ncbi:hypothetical protein GN109_17600 [Collimonas pratensis]|uniref:hypothetical protein n=1 Tax=Collimonas pratensis TaxID=279113 RepID=UPI00143D66A8|nr:hypothetical protein [Collimonas pratensis]NKI71242.1 hypothetical protein [Collimonas pratensis]
MLKQKRRLRGRLFHFRAISRKRGYKIGRANKNARLRGHLYLILAEWTGLAYMLQAAAAPAGAALRFPPEAAQAASSTPQSDIPQAAI